jgi:hypothetical protein
MINHEKSTKIVLCYLVRSKIQFLCFITALAKIHISFKNIYMHFKTEFTIVQFVKLLL